MRNILTHMFSRDIKNGMTTNLGIKRGIPYPTFQGG